MEKIKFTPDILTFSDGRKVTDKTMWQERRREIIKILSENEYGFLPERPTYVKGEITRTVEKCCSGDAYFQNINLKFDTPKGEFTLPISLLIPKTDKKVPVFLFLTFRGNIYDMYIPTEEVADSGFAVAYLNYEDVTSDSAEEDGIFHMFPRKNDGTDFGKISLWAWAGSRVVDYLMTREEIDGNSIAVIGHSRLGKTALWCACNDERISYCHSNCSGCSGAAYEKAKHEGAETVKDITTVFPYWFCENYKKFADNSDKMPFDQHLLVGSIAPRFVCVSSASLDKWADQYSEQLSCIGASDAWKLFGKKGFAGKEEPFEVGEKSLDGDIGYFMRRGIHFLGRKDWMTVVEFINKKRNQAL